MLLPNFGPKNKISRVIIILNLANIGKLAKIIKLNVQKFIFNIYSKIHQTTLSIRSFHPVVHPLHESSENRSQVLRNSSRFSSIFLILSLM